jgi:phage-related protein
MESDNATSRCATLEHARGRHDSQRAKRRPRRDLYLTTAADSRGSDGEAGRLTESRGHLERRRQGDGPTSRLPHFSTRRTTGERSPWAAGRYVSLVRQCCVLVVLPACRREIDAFPEDVRADLADALARLDAGLMLSMPLSRPMPTMGRRVHELRLKDRSGAYRVVYALVRRGTIYVIHAFKKTTQATPLRSLELTRKRLKEVMQ